MHVELTLTALGVVIPPDSGLLAASAEGDFLMNLANAHRNVTPIPPRIDTLRKALASASFDGLHFTGHGKYAPGNADRSSIRLEGNKRFMPEHVSGVVRNLGQKRPLVFLNACEIGRSGKALGTMAGWPRAFLAAGVGAFIGPYWKIGDGTASLFTQTFYTELVGGSTVGEAAKAARLAIKSANDPTWIAYTVFAHASARITSPPGGT
jgi:CHAT domain-containing protein